MIQLPGPANPLPRGATAPQGGAGWRVGEILRATVLGVDDGITTMAVGDARLKATLATPVPVGTTLFLRVLQPGATPVLEPLAPPQTARAAVTLAPAPGGDAAGVAAQLRTALPLQDSPATLLADLEVLTTARAPVLAERPALAAAAKAVLGMVPTPDEVAAPARLREAVEQSGTFLEARLARAVTTPAASPLPDLKAAVLGLLASLPRAAEQAGASAPAWTGAGAAPPQPHLPPSAAPPAVPMLGPDTPTTEVAAALKAGAEATLARIEVAQLGSLRASDGTGATWLVELPLRTPQGFDVLSMRIERDDRPRRADPRAEPGWSLDLAVDLEGLGPVHARVALCGGVVNAALWAEDGETADLIAGELGWLAARLDAAGLGGGTLTCARGSPPRSTATAAAGTRLLDETA